MFPIYAHKRWTHSAWGSQGWGFSTRTERKKEQKQSCVKGPVAMSLACVRKAQNQTWPPISGHQESNGGWERSLLSCGISCLGGQGRPHWSLEAQKFLRQALTWSVCLLTRKLQGDLEDGLEGEEYRRFFVTHPCHPCHWNKKCLSGSRLFSIPKVLGK